MVWKLARFNQALSDGALSTFDNDTMMNGSGEQLEFKFGNEIQPLGTDHQASMARGKRMLCRRPFEATRFSITMPENGALASNTGALKCSLIMANGSYNLLFDDIVQASPSSFINPNGSGIVPSFTPYIQ